MSYLLRRLAACAAQLAAVSLLTFLLFSVIPGDFYSAERWNPQSTSASLDQWRKEQGLDQPWPRRYSTWLRSCARGDFGVSTAYRMPVSRLLAPRLSKTLQVVMPALLASWMFGIGLAFVAVRGGRGLLLRGFESGAGSFAMAPDVLVVSLLVWIAVWTGASLTSVWLPAAGLALVMTPAIFLHASRGLAAARDLAFVRIAAQRGVPAGRLWLRFVLPAAANPLVSLFGLSIAGALSASLAAEAITGWPGLGPLFLEAVQSRDYPVVQAVVLLLAAVLTFSNLAADLALYRLDPRIRLAHEAHT